MRIKIVMDSGKEYIINEKNYSFNELLNSFYKESPTGARNINNSFEYLDGDGKIVINPTHISSIEVIEK